MVADISGLEAKVRRHGVALMEHAGAYVGTETSNASPVDTGRLRANHGVSAPVELGSVVSVTITADTPYAKHVAYGARPHEIRPRNARALRFRVGGRTVYATVVRHPGTRARPEWWSEEALSRRFAAGLQGAVQAVTTS